MSPLIPDAVALIALAALAIGIAISYWPRD